MVKFNIVSTGFIDVSDPSGISFKIDNHLYRFCDISLARSTEFSVPATERNRRLLQFGEDPAEDGLMMRRNFKAQMVYDGGVVDGTLAVTSYDGNTFKCVFEMHLNERLEQMMGKKLADMALDHDVVINWNGNDIALADTTQDAQLIMYDRDGGMGTYPPVPAINIKNLIANLVTPITYGTGYATDFQNYWLIAGSMKGGLSESVYISTNAANNMTATGDTYGYFTIEDINIEWGTIELWSNGVIGGGSFSAKGLKATQDIKITFPQATIPTCYVIQWSRKMTRYKQLAGPDLNGKTIEVPRDGIIFFAATKKTWQGYQDTLHPFSVTVDVEAADNNLAVGDDWRLSCNLPDMTFFEFLKSAALATGNDLTVDGHDISIIESVYGPATTVTLDNVISVDKVSRWVEPWGNGTKKATVAFSSEDYVTAPLRTDYEIDNTNLTGEKETKSLFSEGGVGTDGVQVNDFDFSGSPAKFSAKKWTIAYAEDGDKFLTRVEAPSLVAYDDIANNATAVVAKVLAPLSDFVGLSDIMESGGFHRLYIWRGVSYVWTSASWSDGVMTLTLQKVSQTNE